jgi:hypothetical protein
LRHVGVDVSYSPVSPPTLRVCDNGHVEKDWNVMPGKAGKRATGRSKTKRTTSVKRPTSSSKSGALTPEEAAAAKKCCVQGCTAAHHARGYCKSHYSQLRRRGNVQDGAEASTPLCEVAGCGEPVEKQHRCKDHLNDKTPRMTKSERLLEIRSRHELMRKEIERIRQSFEAEGEDE